MIDLGKDEKSQGLSYTAFSRATRLGLIGVAGGMAGNRLTSKNSRQIRPSEKEERRQEIEDSTNRHGTPGTGPGVGSLVGPEDGPTVATSSYTSLMHGIYSNHRLYYLASLTRTVGDSRVHRLLPNQQALYNK